MEEMYSYKINNWQLLLGILYYAIIPHLIIIFEITIIIKDIKKHKKVNKKNIVYLIISIIADIVLMCMRYGLFKVPYIIDTLCPIIIMTFFILLIIDIKE